MRLNDRRKNFTKGKRGLKKIKIKGSSDWKVKTLSDSKLANPRMKSDKEFPKFKGFGK